MDISLSLFDVVVSCDPGAAGGLAFASRDNASRKLVLTEAFGLPEEPESIHLLVSDLKSRSKIMAAFVLENVHAMPHSGRASMFIFGRNFGRVEMAAIASGFRIFYVTPHQWMKQATDKKKADFQTASEWKNHLKSIAQRRYPLLNPTLKTADAILIGDYALSGGKKVSPNEKRNHKAC